VVLTSGLEVEEQISPEYDFKGYLITNDIPVSVLSDAHQALKSSLMPAEEDLVAKALLKLRALTAHKADGKDLDIILEAYLEKLREYPKDAVLESLNRYPDHAKWFPSWAELRDDVEFRCVRRLELLKAIERKINERQLTQVRENTRTTA